MQSCSCAPRKIQQLAADSLPARTHSYPHDAYSSRCCHPPALIHLDRSMAFLAL